MVILILFTYHIEAYDSKDNQNYHSSETEHRFNQSVMNEGRVIVIELDIRVYEENKPINGLTLNLSWTISKMQVNWYQCVYHHQKKYQNYVKFQHFEINWKAGTEIR